MCVGFIFVCSLCSLGASCGYLVVLLYLCILVLFFVFIDLVPRETYLFSLWLFLAICYVVSYISGCFDFSFLFLSLVCNCVLSFSMPTSERHCVYVIWRSRVFSFRHTRTFALLSSVFYSHHSVCCIIFCYSRDGHRSVRRSSTGISSDGLLQVAALR